MPHSPERYLFDIQSACDRIEMYTAGLSFSSYQNVAQLKDSVERCLEIIGEATRKLLHHYPEFKPLFPYASSMIGLRNILAHEYGEVEDERVWWVAENRVPELKTRISEELLRRKKEKNEGK